MSQKGDIELDSKINSIKYCRKSSSTSHKKELEYLNEENEEENDVFTNNSKFLVTKLEKSKDTIDLKKMENCDSEINNSYLHPTTNFSTNENQTENAFLNSSSSSSINPFANRKSNRFKQQNSVIDPFPHFDNYRNNLLSLSTSFSNTTSKINSSSNLNSMVSLNAEHSSSISNTEIVAESVPNANSPKRSDKSIRPTLHELQTSLGSPIKSPLASEKSNKSRTSPLKTLNNRLSFRSKNKIKKRSENEEPKTVKKKPKNSVIKFGWIEGVLIRCILNIFGIMIFLRLTWVVGQAGLGLSTVIIGTATVVTLITALSTSAISTNGEIKGGGAYYLISRSLGPEFGGAIGIVFSFANVVASAMYVIGFSETLVFSVLGKYNLKLVDGAINDVRIIGLITVVLLTMIALVGMKWEAKVQIFLLAILTVAFINYLIGAFIPPSEQKLSKGFIGFNLNLVRENFKPDFRDGEDFAHVFAIFFPAVTGILAGANISGNLKNPQKAIPKGTILSIFITSFIYLLFAWVAGFTVMREAPGLNSSMSVNITSFKEYCQVNKCQYGLLNDYEAISLVSLYGPIIIAGIFSASLSSALASLVSAPKIFQAVGKDKLFPKIDYFAVGYGKDKEPWRGYALTLVIASLFISIGELNAIAPLISNFFLMSYALINYACFDASFSKTPGWRPSFKYYNKWISLSGAIICISIMFLIKWTFALVSFLIVYGIYSYVRKSKPDVNWGSTGQANIYRNSLENSLKLINIKEHVKNYRPNFLVLTGEPSKRPALCDLISAISKKTSLMVCANVNITNDQTEMLKLSSDDVYNWFRKLKIKSFFTDINASSVRIGVNCLMQSSGIGKLKPNTIVMGFKNDWQFDKVESTMDYYNLINDIFQMEFSLLILRIDGGLDYSGEDNVLDDANSSLDDVSIKFDEENDDQNNNYENELSKNHKILIDEEEMRELMEDDKKNDNSTKTTILNLSTQKHNESTPNDIIISETIKRNDHSCPKLSNRSSDLIMLKNAKINTGVLQGMKLFHNRYQEGFVDVYWLHDDGGLTILLPYLLSQRQHWKKCKLRIFIQTNSKKADIAKEQKNMEMLLTKFRIKFHELIILSNLKTKPNASTLAEFDRLLDNWRLKPNENLEDFPHKITDAIYEENLHKINYYSRIREVLNEYSKESTLIFVTITVPNKIRTCPGLYMSYLDIISHKMPPIIMIRGNQNQVVTYYS